MNVSIKSLYTDGDFENILYPLVYYTIRGSTSNIPRYTDDIYVRLVNQLLSSPIDQVVLMQNFFEKGIELYINTLYDFATINDIKTDDLFNWYVNPKLDNSITIAIKRLLYTGVLFHLKKIYSLDQFINIYKTKQHEYIQANNIFFLDGDNLYLHGSRFFQLTDGNKNNYGFTFFKQGTISPNISILSEYSKTKNYIIDSYAYDKDAADVILNELLTFLKYSLLSFSQDNQNKTFYILTGDHYANEILESGIEFVKSNNLTNVRFRWVNTQVISYIRGIKSAKDDDIWAYNPNDFPIYEFGVLSFPRYSDEINISNVRGAKTISPVGKLKINIGDIGRYLKRDMNFIGEKLDGLNVKYPIASSYIIRMIKSGIGFMSNFEIDFILRRFDVINYDNFITVLSNWYGNESIINFKDEYLVLMGSKLLTRKEIRNYFYNEQFNMLTNLRLNLINRGILTYKINRGTPEYDIMMKIPQNDNILKYLYKFLTYREMYYKHLDIDIALGIIDVGITLTSNLNPDVYPESVRIDYFEIKVK